MTAPRIDVVRKLANAAITKIAEAIDHVEDLHAIGWYRHTNAAGRERVRGGTTDYALDNNGDPRAREAYEHLARELLLLHQPITTAIDNALAIFDPGLVNERRDRTADATGPEVAAAIARLEKRHREGEWVSAARITQPSPAGARQYLDATALHEELDALRNAARKAGRHPDRSRLTPREQTAWDTALGTTGRRKKARTSHPR